MGSSTVILQYGNLIYVISGLQIANITAKGNSQSD